VMCDACDDGGGGGGGGGGLRTPGGKIMGEAIP
jgi:hypothetical protein